MSDSAKLSMSSASIDFGQVTVGSQRSQAVKLTNSGGSNCDVSSVSVNGAHFTVSGASAPFTLAASQSATVKVTFAPAATGSASGNLVIASNAANSPATIPLSGTGATLLLGAAPTSLNFGDVIVGSGSRQTVTLTNTGTESVTVSQATATGAGFSMSGLSLPLTLAAGQQTTFNATFAPAATGNASGSLSIASNAANSPATILLSGTGATLLLGAAPTSLDFGNVIVGSSSRQTVTLTNTGTESVTVSRATATGAGFSVSGLSVPLTLAAGQQATFNATFAPAATGNASGNLVIASNAANSPATIPLSGTGATLLLGAAPASLNFRNVIVGSSSRQTVTLTNTGTESVTVSRATVAGAGFSISGLSLPLTLAAGQQTTFNGAFAPAATGSASGSLSIASNAANSPATIPLSGTGATLLLGAAPTSLNFGDVIVGSGSRQ
ncbi:MAG TPA: choice-of-anchor D domain-containing protein, partial [Terriglobia bacterium]|nr:choice-of-anchor D domain-containing protein [Terriglobia bacterium]